MTEAPAAQDAPARSSDLALARVHLRLGSLALARAELETLASHDALDEGGLVDLAEARWRTGDLEGAGEAALAAIDDDDGPLVALVIAGEAAAARGRPTEARRYVDRAMAVADGAIDAVFAGMPRASAWPPDPAAPPPAPTTMFDPPHGPARSTPRPPRVPDERRPSPAAVRSDDLARAASTAPALVAATPPSSDSATIAMWAEPELAARTEADARTEAGLPLAEEALERGRAALESGNVPVAATALTLVLRLSGDLAPAVIDLVGARTEPELAFVRGDAYRQVGRELDALAAYAVAARAADEPATTDPIDLLDPPQGDHA